MWSKGLLSYGQLRGVVALPGDRLWAVGSARDSGQDRPVRVLFDATGHVRQTALEKTVIGAHEKATLHGGKVVIAGWQRIGITTMATLAGMDGLGNRQWQQTIDLDGGAELGLGIAGLSDGKLALVGEQDPGNKAKRGLVVRATAFGHVSCAAAGKCIALSPQQCDDGKACTADLCDGQSGCVHLAAKDFSCVPEDGCSRSGTCVADTCEPGDDGKLHARSLDATWVKQTVIGMAAEGKGARLFLDNAGNLLTTTVDEGGDVQAAPATWWKHSGFSAGWYEVGAGTSGDWFARGWQASNGGYVAGRMVRLDGAGKQLWLKSAPGSVGNGGSTSIPVMVVRQDGAVVAFPHQHFSGTVYASALAWLPSGAQQFKTDVLPAKTGTSRSVVTAALDPLAGVYYGATRTGKLASTDLLIGRVDKVGKHLDFDPVDLGGDERVLALHPMDDGHLLIAARQAAPNGTFRSVLLITKPDAKAPTKLVAQWQKVAEKPDNAAFSRIVPLAKGPGGYLLLGTVHPVSGPKLLARVADSKGAPLWESEQKVGDTLLRVATRWQPSGDGGYLAGGRALYGATELPFIARTNAWGHSSCTAAGKCAAKAANGCDDGKACTLDACAPDKGCVHSVIAGCQ